jgi:hypothetical protein
MCDVRLPGTWFPWCYETGLRDKDPRGRSLGYPSRQDQGATVLQQASSSASQHVERTGEEEERNARFTVCGIKSATRAVWRGGHTRLAAANVGVKVSESEK